MTRTEPEGDVVLERGWTRRRAPRNAASYLISPALRWGARHLGWRTVKAFSDPRFGERGLVYKAVGFKPFRHPGTARPSATRWSRATASIRTAPLEGASKATLPPPPPAARVCVSLRRWCWRAY
jgi:hypothetical protein